MTTRRGVTWAVFLFVMLFTLEGWLEAHGDDVKEWGDLWGDPHVVMAILSSFGTNVLMYINGQFSVE